MGLTGLKFNQIGLNLKFFFAKFKLEITLRMEQQMQDHFLGNYISLVPGHSA
jgi:hypothetical protein